MLKELRKSKNLTQIECSKYLGIPLRTYQCYEYEDDKISNIKYQYIVNKLSQYGYIDEEHGILTIDKIKSTCNAIMSKYDIQYCYLFGSYAKGYPSENSDVDLFISSSITGLKYFGLVEELRENLKKKVEIINQDQIKNNFDLMNEILKDGVKIYG